MTYKLIIHHIKGADVGHFRAELRPPKGDPAIFAVNTVRKTKKHWKTIPNVAFGFLPSDPSNANSDWDGVLQDESKQHGDDIKNGVPIISKEIDIDAATYKKIYDAYVPQLKRGHRRTKSRTGTPKDYELLPIGEHYTNCAKFVNRVVGMAIPSMFVGNLFTSDELKGTWAGRLVRDVYRSRNIPWMFREAFAKMEAAGVEVTPAVHRQTFAAAERLGFLTVADRTPTEIKRFTDALVAEVAGPIGARSKGPKQDGAAAAPTILQRVAGQAAASGGEAAGLDEMPVGVLVPKSGDRPEEVVTMRAGTPIRGRNGKRTTIRRYMAQEGFDLRPELGAFVAPGASKREAMWFDWGKSGRRFDPALALDEPVRWLLPE